MRNKSVYSSKTEERKREADTRPRQVQGLPWFPELQPHDWKGREHRCLRLAVGQRTFPASGFTAEWDGSGGAPSVNKVSLGVQTHLARNRVLSECPWVAPERGLPCALQKTNVRTIRTSKQPPSAEKAVPRMLRKEVGGAGPPAGGEAWRAQPGAGLAQSLGRTGRKQLPRSI